MLVYYPYLRAKQYELKALKEFSSENKGQAAILPIIEPVKRENSVLSLAIKEMQGNALKFALILNPSDGDYKHATVHFDLRMLDDGFLLNKDGWIPAFLYSRYNIDSIKQQISDYQLKDVMLVFRDGMDADDAEAWDLIRDSRVRFVVNAFGSMVSRRLVRRLFGTDREIIRLDSCFKSKPRNVDYLSSVDDFFSEVPFYAEEDGFGGYSDYTTLPSEYVEGGMLPYALVIHLSYQKNEDQLYVHHFVSDSNETNSNVSGKFYQAAQKVEPFYRERARTAAVEEIIERATAEDGYPGLGYLKKLSIKNHLELILSLNR